MAAHFIVNGRVQCPVDEAERQYNLQAAFPDYPQVRQGWIAKSEQLKAQRQPLLDLAYGSQPLQTLDLYKAANPGRPLLVFIHGGYWQGGDKADVSFMARPFLEADINVALLNYSLAPHSPIEDMMAEMRQAFGWLAARAAEFGFDAKAISVMGHSAGGHLATTTASYAARPESGLPVFRQVISISGVHDLPPLLPSSVNKALGLDQARAEALSPLTHPAPEGSVVYTLVGQNETLQFHAQSLALRQAWPQVKAHYEVADTDHFTILDVLADSASEHSRRMVEAVLA